MCVGNIVIKHKREHWQSCVDSCIAEYEIAIVNRNRSKRVEASENGLNKGYDHTTMDDELTQRGTAFVRESPVPNYKLFNVREFEHGEISSQRCLHTLLANNS